MNSFEKAAVVGAIGMSSIVGCSTEDDSEPGDSYTVTQAALPWYKTGETRLRKSRDGAEVCIKDDVFQTTVSVGDKVKLIVDQSDQCQSSSSVKEIRGESEDTSEIVCEVEGSLDQLEYLDSIFDYQSDDFLGFSLTGETDNGGGNFDVWWEVEEDFARMVNPPIVATREDSDYGTLNTYQYRFDIPSNLVPFVFEDSDKLYSGSFIAANYWFKKSAVVYLGFDGCRVEE